MSSQKNLTDYPWKPIVIEAKKAHLQKWVVYQKDGSVKFKHPDLQDRLGVKSLIIPPGQQQLTIQNTIDALDNALSNQVNSPLLPNHKTLRQKFDQMKTEYERLVDLTYEKGEWEPDFGCYIFDPKELVLYRTVDKEWWRWGLITSPAMLITDPQNKLSWFEKREKMDNFVVGIGGNSVGGNIAEGIFREVRPMVSKHADPDYLEHTNLSRAERMSLRYIVGSRAQRKNLKNPYEATTTKKLDGFAHEQHLVDPFCELWLYREGLNQNNFSQFLLGDGKKEPKVDLFIDEMDHPLEKQRGHELCRKFGIDEMQFSDFGPVCEMQFWAYSKKGQHSLGYKLTDQEFKQIIAGALEGKNREARFKVFDGLCGPFHRKIDGFSAWEKGEGEQPVSSIPQSGATAMSAGSLAGIIVSMYILGFKIPNVLLVDMKNFRIKVEYLD
jgi:hypothetical protein